MSRKYNFNSIKSAIKAEPKTTSSNYYPYYKMNVGDQAVVRFLPDLNEENPFGFFVERFTHTLEVGGETKTVPCLSSYGKPCPICEVSSRYYKANDKENGKKYWKKRGRLAQVLVVSDPMPPNASGETFEGKVCLLNISYQLFEIIKNSLDDFDDDAYFFDFENGTDFNIKKTQQGEYVTYATGSKFARKSSSLDADTVEYVQEHMVDLSTQVPPEPAISELTKLLKAEANNDEYTDDDVEEAEEEPVVINRSTPKKKETKPVLDEQEDDEDLSGDDILATIRRGRK